jgi:hypothetical protein
MRGLGYRVVDMIVAHHLSVRDKPVVRRAPRAVHDTWLAEPIPRTGREPEMVLDLVGNTMCSLESRTRIIRDSSDMYLPGQLRERFG